MFLTNHCSSHQTPHTATSAKEPGSPSVPTTTPLLHTSCTPLSQPPNSLQNNSAHIQGPCHSLLPSAKHGPAVPLPTSPHLRRLLLLRSGQHSLLLLPTASDTQAVILKSLISNQPMSAHTSIFKNPNYPLWSSLTTSRFLALPFLRLGVTQDLTVQHRERVAFLAFSRMSPQNLAPCLCWFTGQLNKDRYRRSGSHWYRSQCVSSYESH